MITKSKGFVSLGLTFVLLLLAAGAFFFFKFVQNISRPSLQRGKTTFVRNYPTVIKGNWEPSGESFKKILDSYAGDIKELGVNTVSVVPSYEYKEGKPHLKGFSGEGFGANSQNAKEDEIQLIVQAKEAGFAVLVCPDFVGGEGAKLGVDQDTFLKDMKAIALEWATIAEEYQVEFFCPGNELNWIIQSNYYLERQDGARRSAEVSDIFHRNLLPELKAVFSGKTIHLGGTNSEIVDAKGYDYIGLDFGPYEQSQAEFRQNVKRYFDIYSRSAKNSGNQWLITETGVPYKKGAVRGQEGQPIYNPSGQDFDELQDEYYQIMIDEYLNFDGEVKPSGFIFHAYIMQGIDIKDRPAEEVLRNFFNQLK